MLSMSSHPAMPRGGSLGLGLATLMRLPSEREQLSVLHAAMGMGYRHFDVAPSYGLGIAETVLGKFLARQSRSDFTVATKIGILPSRRARILGPVQGPLRRALRGNSRLKSRAQRFTAGAVTTSRVDAETVSSSISRSIDRLRVGRIDIVLLHDVPFVNCRSEVLEVLAAEIDAGRVGAAGVAAPPDVVTAYREKRNPLVSVFQTCAGDTTGMTESPGLEIRFGALAGALPKLMVRLEQDRILGARLSDTAGLDVYARGGAATLLTAAALRRIPDGVVLVGSTSVQHLRELRRATEVASTLTAQALDQVDRAQGSGKVGGQGL